MRKKKEHILSNIDSVNRIGYCKKCGLVKLKKRPKCWRCINIWKVEANRNRKRRKYGESYIKESKNIPKFCAICKKKTILVYDHDHLTGSFRGWICRNCNLVLGLSFDDIEILQKAIKYLEESVRRARLERKIMFDPTRRDDLEELNRARHEASTTKEREEADRLMYTIQSQDDEEFVEARIDLVGAMRTRSVKSDGKTVKKLSERIKQITHKKGMEHRG